MVIATPQIGTDIEPRRRRWTRADFERVEAAGLFGADERLELIGGDIFEEAPVNSPHATGFTLVDQALRAILSSGLLIRTQIPIAIGTDSQPLPDIAIVEGTPRDFRDHHPTTALLVVEVADTTLTSDRTIKASLYASAGIPEYWILNLYERLLEVHHDPAPSPSQPFGHGYRSILRLTETETVAPLFAPDARIPVSDLLP